MIKSENRIRIFGSKDGGTYVVEFRTAQGEALTISIPPSKTAVIQNFSGAHAVRAVRPACNLENSTAQQGASGH